MKAAYYTDYGAARDVLKVGELPDPVPEPGEVRVRIRYSGINPSDCNRRRGIRDRPGYPLIIPHSDGAGEIDKVGEGMMRAALANGCGPGTPSAGARSAPRPSMYACHRPRR